MQPFWTITAGGDDRLRRDEHSRTGNDSLINCLFQTDVGVSGAFGAKVANGCETGLQRVAQVIRRAGYAQTQRLARDLIVPNGFAVRMQ